MPKVRECRRKATTDGEGKVAKESTTKDRKKTNPEDVEVVCLRRRRFPLPEAKAQDEKARHAFIKKHYQKMPSDEKILTPSIADIANRTDIYKLLSGWKLEMMQKQIENTIEIHQETKQKYELLLGKVEGGSDPPSNDDLISKKETIIVCLEKLIQQLDGICLKLVATKIKLNDIVDRNKPQVTALIELYRTHPCASAKDHHPWGYLG